MGTVVENAGTGTFGDVQNWSVTENASPFVVSDTVAGIGDATMTVIRMADTELAVDNTVSIVHSTPGSVSLGRAKFTVNDVDMGSKKFATLTLDSILAPFISGTILIPGVESGSPHGALDLACQLGGIRGSSDRTLRTAYWSLAGHSVGFDYQGNRVIPTGTDLTFLKPNVYAPTGSEPVQYQEIIGLAQVSGFSGTYFPTSVLGGTPRVRTARTYLKFKTVDASAGTYTWSYQTGPDFQNFPALSDIRDSTMTVTVTYVRATEVLTATIAYRNDAGSPATATATTTATALSNTGKHMIAVETYFNSSSQMVVRAGVIDDAGLASTAITATTAAVATPPAYAGQWSLIAAGGTVRDLLVREGSLTLDQWAAFFTNTYVNATAAFTDSLTDARLGSPIAAVKGELWGYLKQVASGCSVEIAATPAGIILREVGVRVMDLGNTVTVARKVSNAQSARNIEIVNQATTLAATPTKVFDADQTYSVDVGETNVVTVRDIPLGVSFLYSPRPDAAALAQAVYWTFQTRQPASKGFYYISAQDNLPVQPNQWITYGGAVYAAIDADGVATLTLVGPKTAIPGVKGPFRLSQSDGATDHPQVTLAGLGVPSNPQVLNLPTGVDPAKTNVQLASRIDNVAISDLGRAYDRGSWAIARASGPVGTITFTVDFVTLAAFGAGPGSVVTQGYAKYRIDTVNIGSDGQAHCSASRFTTIADYQAVGAGETIAAFTTRWAGLSLGDFAIRPLLPPPPVVGTAPAIVTPSANSSITVNTSQVLASSATGSPTPTVKWEYCIGSPTGTYIPLTGSEAFYGGGTGITASITVGNDSSGNVVYFRARYTNGVGSPAVSPYYACTFPGGGG